MAGSLKRQPGSEQKILYIFSLKSMPNGHCLFVSYRLQLKGPDSHVLSGLLHSIEFLRIETKDKNNGNSGAF